MNQMKWIFFLAPLGALAAGSCTPHVAIEPIKVEPIHLTVDVNLRVDHELDEFFAYQKNPATQPTTNSATTQATTAETL
ncbi:MAG TPA: hypothetical protein VL282_04015 [Tepidisphaeraceae bacterium]|nr:hypothetical protein [Tepidisphaeraceae bacterium]